MGKIENFTNRHTGIELLRVISMLMIVSGHSIIHGGYGDKLPLTMNGYMPLIDIMVKIGADICYMIIPISDILFDNMCSDAIVICPTRGSRLF